MSPYAVAMVVYGLLSSALGIVGGLGLGGAKASPASFAGVAIGIVMIGLAVLAKTKPGIAYRVAAVLCILVMANPRFFQGVVAVVQGTATIGEKWVGVTMVAASLALFAYLGYGHMAGKKKA